MLFVVTIRKFGASGHQFYKDSADVFSRVWWEEDLSGEDRPLDSTGSGNTDSPFAPLALPTPVPMGVYNLAMKALAGGPDFTRVSGRELTAGWDNPVAGWLAKVLH